MDLHRADRPAGSDLLGPAKPLDVCLERYPRDLGRALTLAESGHVSAGHAVLFTEAIVDLMSVSGYALLYAELTGTRASWSEIETAWKKWIGENPERLGTGITFVL